MANPATSHLSWLVVSNQNIGPVGQAAGFEDNDGDLTPNNATPPLHDWNDFTPTWTGNAPYQTGTGTGAGGFTFFGITDDSATTTDTGFAGGVKQDDNCPAVIGTKSPNKNDLARAYIAGKLATVNGEQHTFLMLSWVRIPQNTTTSDAHVSFEFNQGTTPCGGNSDSLVQRTAGDLLVVYDFTNGGTPTIELSRWVTSGSCQVGSNSPPCWGPQETLGSGVAEAEVNTAGTVTDSVKPGAPETLGTNEFGEAGIDLTQALFNLTGSRACQHFGTAFAVSRSSGSSNTAQMMDLVGPEPINLSNCASPTITTQASPTTHLTLGQSATVGDTATLHDANNATGDVTFTLYSDDTCQTSTGITGTGTISNGSATFSHSFTPSAAGTYYWIASYPGDGNNDAFTTSCGDANEQIFVDKASPNITTQASPTTHLTVGTAATVGDTATLHNAFNPTGSVSFTLYSDNTCQTSTGVSGGGLISNGSASFSSSFTPQNAGTYYWQASYAGDANNNSFTTGCQDANEQLIADKASPSITTQASPTTTILVGSTVTAGDTATFHNAVNPTGSVTFTLYSNNTCTTSTGISGGGSISSGSASFSHSFTPTAVGTYYWQASYAGDSNNNGFTTGCTDANEQLTVGKASPSITTQASPTADIVVGSTVTAGDTATFANAFQPSGSVTFTLYSNNTCTTSTGISGSGTISSGSASFSHSFTPSAVGTYYWKASYAGDANNNGFTTGCTDANEQLSVIKATPSITTQASPTTNIVVGSTVTAGDAATFHNAFQPSGNVTFTLYSDNQCSVSTGISGTGSISSGSASFSHSFTPTAAGTYYWQASYTGDANNNGFTTGCQDANEQLTVIKATPSITTQASPTTNITVGSTVTAGDAATFHNAFQPSGNVTFTLYSNNTCTTSTGLTGSGSISSGTASFSGSFSPTTVGTYYWIASYAGDANNNGFTTGCGDANEQLTVVKTTPSIATTLSATTGAVGDTVHDSATLTGATSDAGGTAVYTVYKDITCQTPAVAGTDIDNQPTTPVAVSGGKVTDSPGVKFLKAGDYYWQVVYTGDSNNTGATSPCTANDNEHLSIGKNSPTITTTLSATSGAIGATVHDSSTLHGATADASGTATYRVYTNNTCTTLAAAGTDIDGQPAAVAVSGGAVADSPGVTFLRAGDFYWQVVYSGDGNNNGATSPCTAQDNEHLAIAPNHPSISTTLSATEVVAGATVHDSATLTGATANAGGNVTYTVYSNDTCTDNPRDAGTVTVTNHLVPNSNGLAFPNAGTFYWQAAYTGDANNDPATSVCTEEQLQVDSPAITITKNPKVQNLEPGDTANFTIVVTNSGTVTLTNVTVTDALAPNCAKAIGTLAPGQSTSYDCSLAGVQTSFTNSATATGHPPVGPDVTATDTAPVTVRPKSPTITTTLSATTGGAGDTVHDSSTLHGSTPDAGGTATYRIYTDTNCQNLAVAGTDIDAQPAAVTVSGGNVPDSPGVKFLLAGDYYWQVSYAGDSKNNPAKSNCTAEDNEHLAIAKNHPTITTTLSASEIVKGSSVNDSATLTGATAHAGGTVQYTVYSNDTCSAGAQDAGKVTVQDGGVPNSNGVAFPDAGTFYWQAAYSGDANNTAATSVCTEEKLQVDSPSIAITKNPKSQSITTGDTANFTIVVTNTGTVTLTSVQVNDILAPNCAKAIGTLAPGESNTYTCALAAVQQSFTNSATATGHPPVGPDVTATDTAPVTVNQLPPPPPPPPPAPKIDLAITKVGTPNPTTVNKDITWTLTVVNNGPNNATGVTVADPTPAGTTYVSSTSTQGTCTGGAALSCQIGNLNVGQTVTITLVTTANQTGTIPNTATVVGNEAETNTANNTASASVNVVGVFKPPVVACTAVAVTPRQLFVGRTNNLRIKVTQGGKPKAGVRVHVKGSTIAVTTQPSNSAGLVTRKVKPTKAGIVTFTPIASKRCNAPRVGVIGVFTPPVTG